MFFYGIHLQTVIANWLFWGAHEEKPCVNREM
jgi:hypothetical protein